MKTKKLSKKLIVSVVGLVLAIVFSTLSTYAWFTVNRDAEAKGITLNVRAGDDALYISQDYGSGYDINTTIDMTSKYDVLLSDITWNGTNFVDQKGNVATAATNTVTGDYFTIPLYFRANTAGSVVLTDTASRSWVKPGTLTNALDYKTAWDTLTAGEYLATEIASGADLATRAAYASRVMFDNGTSKAIWEPNSTMAFGAGEYNMAQDFIAGFTGNTVLGANYVKPSYDAYKDAAIEDVALAELKKHATDNYYECTITVSIWIEGLDADCFDSILEDIFDVALCFTINEAPMNLQITNLDSKKILSWDTIEGATGYEVSINGTVTTVPADIGVNGYDITSSILTNNYYAIKVRAIMGGSAVDYSLWSKEYIVDTRTVLETPGSLAVDNVGTLTWSKVGTDAESYTVIITRDSDSVVVAKFTTSQLTYDLSTLGLPGDDYTISVQATAATFKTSVAATTAWEWVVPVQLATPTNLQLNGGTLTWTGDVNTISYTITINDGTTETTVTVSTGTPVTASCNLTSEPNPALAAGKTYTITVKAIGDDINYISSGTSATIIVYGTEVVTP